MKSATDQTQLHGLPISEVCFRTGLGRTGIFAAIRDGKLIARKYRRRTLVLNEDLEAFLRALPTTKTVRV